MLRIWKFQLCGWVLILNFVFILVGNDVLLVSLESPMIHSELYIEALNQDTILFFFLC